MRSSSQYQISRIESHELRNKWNQFRNLEVHCLSWILLDYLIINHQFQIQFMWIIHLLYSNQLTNWKEIVLPFSQVPWESTLLQFSLIVPISHVQSQKVSPHIFHRILSLNLLSLLTNHHAQFNLVVYWSSRRQTINTIVHVTDWRCRLCEYHRLLRRLLSTHLLHVFHVVLPHRNHLRVRFPHCSIE